jgi:4-hydroxy-2-oxoheptanedioate aldolase
MKNPVKARLKAGKPALGLLLTFPSVPVAQTVARSGFDWIFIDREHGPIDIATCQAMIAATQGTDCAPIVRVAKIDEVLAKPVLDAGAFGVIFPMVRTVEEAELAAASVRYPPVGIRGIGPMIAAVRWDLTVAEYIKQANREILCVLLIEHIDAVRNIDKILKVKGIDVAQIAPFDLSASMGRTGDLEHKDVTKAIQIAERAILKSGVTLGGLGQTTEKAKAMIAKGYLSIVMTSDVGLLQGAAKAMIGPLQG